MATSEADRDDFITPLPDDERTPPDGVDLRDTPTVEFCPPTPPPVAGRALTFDPAWRTETVIALARGIDFDAAFDRLPILADALEEAGCDHPQLLHHCRTCPHPFASCWVVNVVLDRVPGELPPPEDNRVSADPNSLDAGVRYSFPSGPRASAGRPVKPFRGLLFSLALLVVGTVLLLLLVATSPPQSTPANPTSPTIHVQADTP